MAVITLKRRDVKLLRITERILIERDNNRAQRHQPDSDIEVPELGFEVLALVLEVDLLEHCQRVARGSLVPPAPIFYPNESKVMNAIF